MTITFIPGEPNNLLNSTSQSLWKSHHIIAYGSGNNLIISTITKQQNNQQSSHLQTIYLDSDPASLHISSTNGLIAVSIKHKIIIFKPVNEYMSKPQWLEACVIVNDKDDSKINCLQWSTLEDELVVGSDKSLTLYHVYDEYGSIKWNRRFCQRQPNPINEIKINMKSNKILTVNTSKFDNLIKIWSRISFSDDDESLFELGYLKHPAGTWITKLKWRYNIYESEISESQHYIDASMANIKNIRNYIGHGHNNDNEVLYTFTNDKTLRVWSTYEFNGHSHIKCWNQINLDESCGFNDDEEVLDIVILDSFHLKSILVPFIENTESHVNLNLNDLKSSDFDLILIIGKSGLVNILSVSNLDITPPNSIRFTKINNIPIKFNEHCFPSAIKIPSYNLKDASLGFIQSQQFSKYLYPIAFPDVCVFHNNEVSLLIHDRLKNTLRVNLFNFKDLLNVRGSSSKISYLGSHLIDKFQGHNKSIRKLISSSSYTKSNILLSILNFPQHNYIWEPLLLNPSMNQKMTITKRFQLDIRHNTKEVYNENVLGVILDAILMNDIRTCPNSTKRHHLAIVLEKDGYLSFWNCNGLKSDDLSAELLHRCDVTNNENDRITQEPKAFLLHKLSEDVYCIIGVFEHDIIIARKFTIIDEKSDISVKFESMKVDDLPIDRIHRISTIDSYVSNNLLSIVDDRGHLKILSTISSNEKLSWNKVSDIHTGIKNATKIHGSSSLNKFAIIDATGSKLSVWDSKSGLLEYEESYSKDYGLVRDLDWTFVESPFESSSNAILSVGFSRFVLLYTQLRYDYTNNIPTFAVLKKTDISDYTSHEIGDLIWIDNGYLVIGCGNQFFIDDKWVELGISNNSSIDYTIKQLVMGYHNNTDTSHLKYDISHLVRILNGPLPVYHPQFLIQALFMNKIELVQHVLVQLFKCLRKDETIEWDLNMNMMDMIFDSERIDNTYASLIDVDYNNGGSQLDGIFDKFSPTLLNLLIEKLMKISLPLLTRHQQSTLILCITIVKHIFNNESLDENGRRFLIGFKLFEMNPKQIQLTMRDINWGLHSDNRELLLDIIESYSKNKVTWSVVKQCGLVYWISDKLKLTSLVEQCARNEFSDTRDPSGITSIFFLAIKKKQILIGLWRTASHQERQKMLKFLNNNFDEQRWKSAALKNAFVLLSKHRYIDAAYFFLLADKVKDCCITLANKVEDIELAILVAKVADHDDSGGALKYLMESFILPKAIQEGDRWITSWVFWELNLKEISIQALIKSPIQVIRENTDEFSEQFNKGLEQVSLNSSSNLYLQDDPVLIILFDNLRKRKFNYLKGSLAVNQSDEFQFLMKIASIYTRMGCDYLALMLVKSWEFRHHESDKRTKDSHEVESGGDLFKEFKPSFTPTTEPTTFEEPDMMSAFDF